MASQGPAKKARKVPSTIKIQLPEPVAAVVDGVNIVDHMDEEHHSPSAALSDADTTHKANRVIQKKSLQLWRQDKNVNMSAGVCDQLEQLVKSLDLQKIIDSNACMAPSTRGEVPIVLYDTYFKNTCPKISAIQRKKLNDAVSQYLEAVLQSAVAILADRGGKTVQERHVDIALKIVNGLKLTVE